MPKQKEKEVTILRPNGTSLLDQIERDACPSNDAGENVEYEITVDIIDRLRELIETVGEELHLPVKVKEYVLPKGPSFFQRKTLRIIQKTDLVTTINPNENQLAYVMNCLRSNPTMSALLAYTYKNYPNEHLESHWEVLDTYSIPIIEDPVKKISRIFPSFVTMNDEGKIVPVIRKALSYPLQKA